ncbi:transposase [Streptomyces sp. NPDC005055]
MEATIGRGLRRCGLRRTRYRGLEKTRTQHVLTAAALDLVRADAWLTGTPLATTRTRIRQQCPQRDTIGPTSIGWFNWPGLRGLTAVLKPRRAVRQDIAHSASGGSARLGGYLRRGLSAARISLSAITVRRSVRTPSLHGFTFPEGLRDQPAAAEGLFALHGHSGSADAQIMFGGRQGRPRPCSGGLPWR